MNISELISDDTWNAIKDNYEKKSYTTAITNLFHYICGLIREKSNIESDNTDLMNKAFLGKTPGLHINRLQTQTEKDTQEGIGNILKGMCLALRNPRAHERYDDSKEVADKIILFADHILDFIRDSKIPALIEDWTAFLSADEFVDSLDYAQILIEEIPTKKALDMLVLIFKNRAIFKHGKLNNFVNLLIEKLSTEENQEFISFINQELVNSKDDMKLYMFFSLYPPNRWTELNSIVKRKVEYIVKLSLCRGCVIMFDYESTYCSGKLASITSKHCKYFETKDEILNTISMKLLEKDFQERRYVYYFFRDLIVESESLLNVKFLEGIKKVLTKHFDKEFFDLLKSDSCYQVDEIYVSKIKEELYISEQYFDKKPQITNFFELYDGIERWRFEEDETSN